MSNTQDSIGDSGEEAEDDAESEQAGDDANKEPEGPILDEKSRFGISRLQAL